MFVALLVVIARRWPLSFTLYAARRARRRAQQPQPRLARALRAGDAARSCSAGADVIAEPERERVVLCLAGAGLVAASVLAFTGVLVP